LSDLNSAIAEILAVVRHATMVPEEGLRFTWSAAVDLLTKGRPGNFVECGTWFGGCSFGLALIQKRLFGSVLRPVFMLDSFEGLPMAGQKDGPAAREYQQRTHEPGYYDNCRAPIERVRELRAELGLSAKECPLVPGWFDKSLPKIAADLQDGIALLRVDCDWYDPVRQVLDQLEPLVCEEGVVIIDDYYAWDGAARAVHDYFSANNLAYRIRQIGQELFPAGAWFIKRPARTFGGPL